MVQQGDINCNIKIRKLNEGIDAKVHKSNILPIKGDVN